MPFNGGLSGLLGTVAGVSAVMKGKHEGAVTRAMDASDVECCHGSLALNLIRLWRCSLAFTSDCTGSIIAIPMR